MTSPPIAVVDLDGTLVDTNYQHALAWFRAFRQHGIILPIWRIHRHIGMGGDQLIPALAGEQADRDTGDEIRAAEKALYLATIDEVPLLPGARELLRELKARGCPIVIASSAKQQEMDHYQKMLGAADTVDGWTSSADVDATKPEPDVIQAALAKVGGGSGVMIGDSTWDAVAARRAGLEALALLSGGFCEAELLEAGASMVFESTEDLVHDLDRTPFAR
jgi:HAD superfamily hydrolase (TIGR01549 family)